MSVKVIKYRVRNNGKTFFPGDIIKDLTQNDEDLLVENGFCEYLEKESKRTIGETKDKENKKPLEKNQSGEEQEQEKNQGEEEHTTDDLNIKFNPDEYVQESQQSGKKQSRK